MKSEGPLTNETDLAACSTWRIFASSLMQRIATGLGRQRPSEGTTPGFVEFWAVHCLHRVPAPLFDWMERIRDRRHPSSD